MREAVIVSYARTGLAKSMRGGFNNTHGAVMAGNAIKHAISRAKTFQPQVVGKRIGEYLETPIRDPANYPKSERIFGWEFRFKN